MKRILAILLLVFAAGAFVVLAGGAGPDATEKPKYWVEFDNAFGLIEGGDLKIAGVRAGKITDIELNRENLKARVGIQVADTGFGSLRSDVFCEVRPQSLIGEYFIDCLPGTAKEEIEPGATIPVSKTGSTVPPDLVNNILRKPYRERLRIIISELGAGVAGNAQNLNDAIKRASPALRQTDRVLAVLGSQSRTLGELTENADTVLHDLSENRSDVARWVVEAKEAAQASAERRTDIAAGFRRLPGFLEELEPTMASLGDVADEQTPALQNLNVSADQLERFFGNLGPFADASRPAFRALGKASKVGTEAVTSAESTVRELNKFATGTPELGKNLAMVLEHLDDRSHAVEKDPRSPNGEGYTGLEALLAYVFDQTLSTNIFDSNVHILKVSVIPHSPCSEYADAERAREVEAAANPRCASALGPTQPGVTTPDPDPVPTDAAARKGKAKSADGRTRVGKRNASGLAKVLQGVGGLLRAAPGPLRLPAGTLSLPSVQRLTAAATERAKADRVPSQATQTQLLDYLLAP